MAIGLLTFRMVDVRYMYATTLMVIMFTAIGLCRVGSQVAEWLQRSCNFAKTMAVAQSIGGAVAGVAVVLAAGVIGWPAIGHELQRYEPTGLRFTFASGIREFTDAFQQTYPDQRGKVVVSRYPVTAYYLEAASYPQVSANDARDLSHGRRFAGGRQLGAAGSPAAASRPGTRAEPAAPGQTRDYL